MGELHVSMMCTFVRQIQLKKPRPRITVNDDTEIKSLFSRTSSTGITSTILSQM